MLTFSTVPPGCELKRGRGWRERESRYALSVCSFVSPKQDTSRNFILVERGKAGWVRIVQRNFRKSSRKKDAGSRCDPGGRGTLWKLWSVFRSQPPDRDFYSPNRLAGPRDLFFSQGGRGNLKRQTESTRRGRSTAGGHPRTNRARNQHRREAKPHHTNPRRQQPWRETAKPLSSRPRSTSC